MTTQLIAVALSALLAVATLAADEPKATLADVAFIAGSWQGQMGEATAEEHWTPPAGGAMLAVSRTVEGGKMVAFEFLRIVERDDGIFYIAQPNGGKATEFKLTRHEENTAVFENPEHDFPKMITYAKAKDGGGLVATISGDGKSMDFPFRALKK